jgi:hypothetical protein
MRDSHARKLYLDYLILYNLGVIKPQIQDSIMQMQMQNVVPFASKEKLSDKQHESTPELKKSANP